MLRQVVDDFLDLLTCPGRASRHHGMDDVGPPGSVVALIGYNLDRVTFSAHLSHDSLAAALWEIRSWSALLLSDLC